MTTLEPASSVPLGVPAQTTGRRARWLCIGAILLAAQGPLLTKLAAALWQRPQYQFFPLMLAGAGLLAWERWRDLPRRDALRAGTGGVAVGLSILSLMALLLGGLFLIRSMALVSTILLLAAGAWQVGGSRLLRAVTPSLVLLAVLVPPPGHLDEKLTLSLQHLAVRASSRLLDLMGVVHVRSGNVLEIPGRRLLIEQACSGINSLISILGFALLLGFYRGRRAGHIVLLLPGAFAFVIGANVLRITVEAWLKVRWGIDVLDGARHEILGLLLFLICAGLVVSFDQLLLLVMPPRTRAAPVASAPSAHAGIADRALPSRGRTAAVEWGIAACFAIAGLFVWTQVGSAWPAPAIRDHAAFHLPQELAGWTQRDDDGDGGKDRGGRRGATIERPQVLGAKSSVWRFGRDGLIASVALDYPFVGYHDLASCYALAGWSIDPPATHRGHGAASSAGDGRADGREGGALEFARIGMSKASILQGELLYGLLNEDGTWMPVTSPTGPAARVTGVRRWFAVARRDGTGRPTYQVQVFVQTYSPLSAEQEQAIETLFRESSSILARQTLSQLGPQR